MTFHKTISIEIDTYEIIDDLSEFYGSDPYGLAELVMNIDAQVCSWDFTAAFLSKLIELTFTDFKHDFDIDDEEENAGTEEELFLIHLMKLYRKFHMRDQEDVSEEDCLWHVENAARAKTNIK